MSSAIRNIPARRRRALPAGRRIDHGQPAGCACCLRRLDSRLAPAVRGVAGVVTDGGFRDSPEIAGLDIPAYLHRPSAPTNLTLHQAIEINVPIGCGDVPVFPGDVVVGDNEGVVVIPCIMPRKSPTRPSR